MYVVYVHELYMTLTFDLKVKFVFFLTQICAQAIPF